VAIARALVVDPPVLLADEPTAHLDHVQVEVVRGMLRRIADSGRMVIVSTHDDRLLTAADRVVDLRPSGPSLVDPVAPDESILALTGGR
jgi:putative ABC transport system ATP-binding protein